MNDNVSAWRVEQAIVAWQSARARLLADDADLAHDEAALTELLGTEDGDVRDILARLLRGARHAKTMADGAAVQIEEMQGRKARYQRRAEAMRATAFAIMDVLGEKKIELSDLTASIRAGQPSVVITNENEVPDIYVHMERKIDKQVIASVLKNGGCVPGAELSNTPPSLTVRVR